MPDLFTMACSVQGKELAVSGRVLRTVRLRHEWCDFVPAPLRIADDLRAAGVRADVFTFVQEIGDADPEFEWTKGDAAAAVLPLTTHQRWWTELGFKPRNKVRKAQKSGIDVRLARLDDAFARGVEAIYAETPVKQGRKFAHFGQSAAAIKAELASFADHSLLVGAYLGPELVGFMKLFVSERVLRTIHIIGSTKHREKCVMDAFISKAVELGCARGCSYLHYGSWTEGGIGTFREKHGFERRVTNRYFVPLTLRGHVMLALSLHQPLRDRLPRTVVNPLRDLRARWNALRYSGAKTAAEAQ